MKRGSKMSYTLVAAIVAFVCVVMVFTWVDRKREAQPFELLDERNLLRLQADGAGAVDLDAFFGMPPAVRLENGSEFRYYNLSFRYPELLKIQETVGYKVEIRNGQIAGWSPIWQLSGP
jgi:hypothetical protein